MKEMLPLGTIVQLNGGRNEYMIIGYMMRDDKQHIRDYAAVRAPAGLLSLTDVYLIDEKDITNLVFRGCDNEKHQRFAAYIKQRLQGAGTVSLQA